MAAPSHVFTIAKVAKMLDEDEALLEEIALDIEPEDGRLYICDIGDDVQRSRPLASNASRNSWRRSIPRRRRAPASSSSAGLTA